jgi:hypothetical protein
MKNRRQNTKLQIQIHWASDHMNVVKVTQGPRLHRGTHKPKAIGSPCNICPSFVRLWLIAEENLDQFHERHDCGGNEPQTYKAREVRVNTKYKNNKNPKFYINAVK